MKKLKLRNKIKINFIIDLDFLEGMSSALSIFPERRDYSIYKNKLDSIFEDALFSSSFENIAIYYDWQKVGHFLRNAITHFDKELEPDKTLDSKKLNSKTKDIITPDFYVE